MSSMARLAGYGGARCCGEKSRDDTRFRSTRSVLDERLKDIHVQLMNDVHGPKYTFSEFMDLRACTTVQTAAIYLTHTAS